MQANIKVHNEFTFVCIDNKTKETAEYKAYNVVTNGGISRLISERVFDKYIHLGTGDGTPSVTDTSLFTFKVYKSTTRVSQELGPDDKTATFRYYIKLDETEQNGITFTEVGLASDTTTQLNTHAMIVDSQGQPMGITKTDTMIMYVYATVYVIYDAPKAAWYGKDSDGIFRLTPGIGSTSAPYYMALYSKGPFSTGDRDSNDFTTPSFYKELSNTTTATGRKRWADILGAEANNRIIKYFGFCTGGNYKHPSLVYNIEDFIELPKFKYTFGFGDGVKTKFFTSSRYPIVVNDKLKVSINEVEVTPKKLLTVKSFEMFEADNLNTGVGNVMIYDTLRKKFYRIHDNALTINGMNIYISIYECENYNDPGTLLATLPTIKCANGSNIQVTRRAMVYPTHVDNKFLLSVAGTNLEASNGTYIVNVDPVTKTATLNKISTADSVYSQQDTSLRYILYSDKLYFIEDNLTMTLVSSPYQMSRMFLCDNMLISIYTGRAYVLGVTADGRPQFDQIEGTFYKGTNPNCMIVKKLPDGDDLYAAIVLKEATAADAGDVVVHIINTATKIVTGYNYKLANMISISYPTWSTTLTGFTHLHGNYETFDMHVDVENKIVYALPVSNFGTGIYVKKFAITNEEKTEAIGTYGMSSTRMIPTKEYVYGIEFDTPPESEATITIEGQRDGVYKTTDYKLETSITTSFTNA